MPRDTAKPSIYVMDQESQNQRHTIKFDGSTKQLFKAGDGVCKTVDPHL